MSTSTGYHRQSYHIKVATPDVQLHVTDFSTFWQVTAGSEVGLDEIIVPWARVMLSDCLCPLYIYLITVKPLVYQARLQLLGVSGLKG